MKPRVLHFLFLLILGFSGKIAAQNGVSPLVSPVASEASIAPAASAPADASPAQPEAQPQFVGGTKALFIYLAQHLEFPAKAARERVMGEVLVRFVVGADGQVTDAAVVRGPGFGLNEEALRLVAQMPAWVPGRRQGQPAAVAYTLPVDFRAIR